MCLMIDVAMSIVLWAIAVFMLMVIAVMGIYIFTLWKDYRNNGV